MWREHLPENCPPDSAQELNVQAFRILNGKEPVSTDFLPYVRLYPRNTRYKSLCEAYAISSFNTEQNAIIAKKKALKRGRNIGSYLARITILPTDGRNELNRKTGHYSTWLYESKDYHTFECEQIKLIDED